jgi:hypothetical protein
MPGICSLPVIKAGCHAAGSAATAVAGSFIQKAAQAFAHGLANLTKYLLTFWTKIDVPTDFGAQGGPVYFLEKNTSWLTGFVLVLGLVIAGGKMAIQQSAEPGKDAAKGTWNAVLYGSLGVPAVALLGVAGDEFSSWILNLGANGDFGAQLSKLFALSSLNPIGPAIVLIVGFFGVLSALAQMMLMIVRIGILTVLAGVLPLSAAAGVTKGGQQQFSKVYGWLLAFLAYKPAAAIIYAGAFAIVGRSKLTQPVQTLSGIFLLMLAIFALPALIRLLVPATAAIAGAASGAGAGAIASGGAVATGAMQMRGRGGSGGSGGGAGGGPSGGPTKPSGSPQSGPSGKGQSAGAGAGGKPPVPAGAGAGGGGGTAAAGAGKGAAAAGGPVGVGVAAGMQAVQSGVQAAKSGAQNAVGDQEPDGAAEQGHEEGRGERR